MIIPKDYLKTIERTGLGKGLFSEMRYNDDGSENPDFVLNKPAYRKAKILVAGDNFGCGSSREHAPWALLDFGIRCVISTELRRHLPQQLLQERHPAGRGVEGRPRQADGRRLARRQRHASPSTSRPRKSTARTAATVKFEIDPFKKHCLLNGLDDIGLTHGEGRPHRRPRASRGRKPPLGLSVAARRGDGVPAFKGRRQATRVRTFRPCSRLFGYRG